jgi:hypothetical protein
VLYNQQHLEPRNILYKVPLIDCCIAGSITDNYVDDCAIGYHIYLHEKDQFWPGLAAEQTGIAKPIHLDVGAELKGSFVLNEKSYLNKPTTPCIAEPNYSYRKCMFAFIARMSGCHLAWVSPHNEKYTPCISREQLLAYNEYLMFTINTPSAKLERETGCLARCKYKEFSFIQKSKEDITWKHNWSSSFFLEAERTMVKYEEELWAFDSDDTINGIGGALGLFLGWSLLDILSSCSSWIGRALQRLYWKIENIIHEMNVTT